MDVEVNVGIDSDLGCLKGVSKSVQVLFNGADLEIAIPVLQVMGQQTQERKKCKFIQLELCFLSNSKNP